MTSESLTICILGTKCYVLCSGKSGMCSGIDWRLVSHIKVFMEPSVNGIWEAWAEGSCHSTTLRLLWEIAFPWRGKWIWELRHPRAVDSYWRGNLCPSVSFLPRKWNRSLRTHHVSSTHATARPQVAYLQCVPPFMVISITFKDCEPQFLTFG